MKPILFSTEMVRAILDGRKTQTRRVVKFLHTGFHGLTGQVMAHQEYKACYSMPKGGFVFWSSACGQAFSDRAYKDDTGGYKCPYGAPGDLLWVRETWTEMIHGEHAMYKADIDKYAETITWSPSIFMPRWASRITLRIADIRVERLQDITPQDVLKEGFILSDIPGNCNGLAVHSVERPFLHFYHAATAFQKLWDSINAKRGYPWASNPWVWCIEFEREAANE